MSAPLVLPPGRVTRVTRYRTDLECCCSEPDTHLEQDQFDHDYRVVCSSCQCATEWQPTEEAARDTWADENEARAVEGCEDWDDDGAIGAHQLEMGAR